MSVNCLMPAARFSRENALSPTWNKARPPREILFSSPMQPEVLNILLDSTQAALTLIVISDEPRLQSLLRVFRDNPSKQALFQAVIEDEIRNSSEMLAGGQNASGDQLEQCLRNYLSTFHVLHPEEGCVLPALGGEITRAEPEVRVAVEKGLKQI